MDFLLGDSFGHDSGDQVEEHRWVARWLWRIVAAVERELRGGTRIDAPKGDPGEREEPMRLTSVRAYQIRPL